MSKESVEVTAQGIKENLSNFKPKHVFAEYIWNAFDAHASNVSISIKKNELGGLDEIVFSDDGNGIPFDELNKKFKPILVSEKASRPDWRNTEGFIKGKNGVGRLTFYHIADQAIWTTTANNKEKKQNEQYTVTIKGSTLHEFTPTSPKKATTHSGTTVSLVNVRGLFAKDLTEIRAYLSKEFSWYIETRGRDNISLTFDGDSISTKQLVEHERAEHIKLDKNDFFVRIITWKKKLNKEHSKFYFVNSSGTLTDKLTTKFNNKGDQFYHSVIVSSSFFDDQKASNTSTEQYSLLEDPSIKGLKRELTKIITNLLADERREFVSKRTAIILDNLESKSAFPSFDPNNEIAKFKHDLLKRFVGGLYQVEPKLFNSLNDIQTKTIVRLLDLIQSGHNRDELLNILKEVVDLSSEQQQDLSELFEVTSLSAIVKTITLIKDRFKAIEHLDALLFNKELEAKEVPHLQEFLEEHFWIFGESYTLVTAAEPSFEKCLRAHRKELYGEELTLAECKIDSPDRRKEPDIFIVRKDLLNYGKHKCVLVELKRPSIKLGNKEFNQIKTYMNVILSEPRFNGEDTEWEFHLIGNEIKEGERDIRQGYNTARNFGEKHLALVDDELNYKIYIHKWSDLKSDLELRLGHLDKHLKLQRTLLAPDENASADDVLYESIKNNSATASACNE